MPLLLWGFLKGVGYEKVDKNLIEIAMKEMLNPGNEFTGPTTPSTPIYFEKQSYDVFTNPNLEVFLERASVTEAIVYGVATDYCIKAAVIGMQERGIQCYVVEDAIKGITPEGEAKAIEEMKSNGAKFITTQQVLEDRLEE